MKKKYVTIFGEGCMGGLAISLGVILSNLVSHPILSPLVFSVGILMCIQFNLGLITKSVPLGKNIWSCLVTYVANVVIAFFAGFGFSGSTILTTPALNPTFGGAILTGIIIGCVAISNKYKGIYTVPLTIILMWTFVYLGLPHCVVYAFWLGCHEVSILQLLLATAGNIVGGFIVYFLDLLLKEYRKI